MIQLLSAKKSKKNLGMVCLTQTLNLTTHYTQEKRSLQFMYLMEVTSSQKVFFQMI